MRRVLLIRHAKSSHNGHVISDHDRPLNHRGKRDAVEMAEHLLSKEKQLEVIISSSATRALEYAKQLSSTLDVPLFEQADFYTFNPTQLCKLIYDLPNQYSQIAIVGHNPAITMTANKFANNSFENIPTSGVVALNCDVACWSKLDAMACTLDYFDYPKMLH